MDSLRKSGRRERFPKKRSLRADLRRDRIRVARHVEDLDARPHRGDPSRHFRPVQARHDDVGQDEMDRARIPRRKMDGLCATGGFEHLVPVGLEELSR